MALSGNIHLGSIYMPKSIELTEKTVESLQQSTVGPYKDLDPDDWNNVRTLGHQMLDDMIDHIAEIGRKPVWKLMPEIACAELQAPLPRIGKDLEQIYQDFQRLILPYAAGPHPRFVGGLHGGGTVAGMLAEMLSAGMNLNVMGRNHSPVKVERQVVRWAAEMLGFPLDASGVLISGTSMANFIAVITARTHFLGAQVRQNGLQGKKLVAYASSAAHVCIARAMDMAGLGKHSLSLIPCDEAGRMQIAALEQTIKEDRAAGLSPFLIVGTAGTAETGAIDNLPAIARICRRDRVWFHVDAAFGAIGMLSPTVRPLLNGISELDSVGFDFHKWGQVQLDCGCILVKDAKTHEAAFSDRHYYCRREERGIATDWPWPCDFGPDLSRSFRALKVWITLQAYGAERIGEVVDHCCELARSMSHRIEQEPELELLAPVTLNIVCFRYIGAPEQPKISNLDHLNEDIVADLQESGLAIPSTAIINNQLAIRASLANHRTSSSDIDAFIDGVLSAGRRRTGDIQSFDATKSEPLSAWNNNV